MFGMGGSEIIVILIVALIFLGPEKLPEVAKSVSKGIRDIKKQSRVLQQSIEDDETIGGALRDIKSALRGEEPPPRPIRKPPVKKELPAAAENSIAGDGPEKKADAAEAVAEAKPAEAAPAIDEAVVEDEGPAKPLVRLPDMAGEADPDVTGDADPGAADAALAAMIKPASGTIAKGAADEVVPESDEPPVPERKHG